MKAIWLGILVALIVTGVLTSQAPGDDHDNRVGSAIVAGLAAGLLAAGYLS
jgi:hypothetical protein